MPARRCPSHGIPLVIRLGEPVCPECRRATLETVQQRRAARQRVERAIKPAA